MKTSHFGLAFAAIAGVTTASASASSESESASSLFGIFSNAAEDNSTTVISDIAALLQQSGSTNGPSSIESAFSTIQEEFSDQEFTIEEAAHRILKAGLIPEDILNLLNGYLDDELNSLENNNPPPKKKIYPTKSTEDAPYSIKEDTLRSAIHIPDTFEYGQFNKTPLILVPGTAIPAGTTFNYNLAKLNKITPKADIVWVNLPKASLSDAQSNAEYIAYAINYISTQCNNKPVTVLSWSQGGLNVQWALKYWPSTREIVKDFIALSPDFHGTIIRSAVCPAVSQIVCTPSLWQQGWDTEFIRTLREDDGDSAYVPTTIIYSSFDEIVQPQFGKGASALLGDVRGVGVSVAHLQSVCEGEIAGGVYTHEGVLYNSFTWALVVDVIEYGQGVGWTERINNKQVCGRVLAEGLDLGDLLGTEGLLVIAVAELLLYQPHTTAEPPIKGYAS